MNRYTKRPVTIEAVQFTRDNAAEVMLWLGEYRGPNQWTPTSEVTAEHISIITLEGDMRADLGDWIIRDVQGEFYPCKPDIFEATYGPERVTRPAHIDLMFKVPPGADSEFIDTVDDEGNGINAGDWFENPDGTWTLRVRSALFEHVTAPTFGHTPVASGPGLHIGG